MKPHGRAMNVESEAVRGGRDRGVDAALANVVGEQRGREGQRRHAEQEDQVQPVEPGVEPGDLWRGACGG